MRIRQVKKYFKKNLVNIIGEPTKFNEYQTYACLYWMFIGRGNQPAMYAKRMLRYLSLDPEIRAKNREAQNNKDAIKKLLSVLNVVKQSSLFSDKEKQKLLENPMKLLASSENNPYKGAESYLEQDNIMLDEVMKNALSNSQFVLKEELNEQC